MRFGVLLALLVAAGTPLLAYIWETLNQLLAGHVSGRRLLITVPLAALLAALLVVAARTLSRVATTAGQPGAEPEPDISGTLFLTAFLLMFTFGGWLVAYLLFLNR